MDHDNHPLPHSKKMKVLTTCAVLFGNITFGCAFNCYAPVLEVLREKFDTTVDQISLVFTIILISYLIGAFSSGFIYYVVNRQLGAIFCLAGMSLGLFLTPHCPTKMMFYIVGAGLGYCFGAYDTAQLVWMIEVWQSRAGPFLQAQHFCYALGSNLPPLLLGPFLSKNASEASNETENLLIDGELSRNKTSPEGSEIFIPFNILGAFAGLACVYQIFLFTFFRYYTPPLEADLAKRQRLRTSGSQENLIQNAEILDGESFLETEDISTSHSDILDSDQSKSSGMNWETIRLVVLTATFIGAYSAMEVSTIQFIPTFAKYSDLKLSNSDAAFVLSFLTATFAIGRGLGIIIIMKVPSLLMLCGNLTLAIIGNLVLLFFASSNIIFLWIACIILGAGLSTTYPSFFVYMEKYLVFNNAISSFILVSSSTIMAIYPLIIGSLIEKNAVIITYTNFVSISACIIALLCCYKVTHSKVNKISVD